MNKVISREYVEKNYIHRSMIQQKINEYEERIENNKKQISESKSDFYKQFANVQTATFEYIVDVLKELLEETKDVNK